jgi:glycosyltransferase involved in cell wall biosynthesis
MDLRIIATPHVEHYTLGLYGELVRRTQVTLVSLQKYDIPAKQIIVPRVPLPGKRTALRNLVLRWISKNYDIIHVNSSLDGVAVKNLDRVVVTEHGFPDPSVEEGRGKKLYQHEQESLIKLSENGVPIVAISHFTASEIKEKLGIKVSNVIYHGVLDIFRAKTPRKAPGVHIVLWNSRLIRFKEPFVLLDAVHKLKNKQGFLVRIRGDGPIRGEIAEYIKRENMSDLVSFVDPVPFHQLPSIYKSASIYVHTCSREPFGLAVLEAMASGLPVIVPRSGGAYEVAGDAALAFNPGDSYDLAEKLEALIEDPELYEKMSEKSLKRASEFSWEKAAEDYLASFDKVISQ